MVHARIMSTARIYWYVIHKASCSWIGGWEEAGISKGKEKTAMEKKGMESGRERERMRDRERNYILEVIHFGVCGALCNFPMCVFCLWFVARLSFWI